MTSKSVLLMLIVLAAANVSCVTPVTASFAGVNRPVLIGCQTGSGQAPRCSDSTPIPFAARIANESYNGKHSYYTKQQSEGTLSAEGLRAVRKYENAFISIEAIDINTFEFGFMDTSKTTSISVRGFVHE